jgi:hypothetical protein
LNSGGKGKLMKTRSLLVYAPGGPLSIESLIPQYRLASMAGWLLSAGHETTVRDYASAGSLRRFCPPGLRAALQLSRDRGPVGRRFPAGRIIKALHTESHERQQAAICQDLCTEPAPDFILFLAENRADMEEARAIACRIRRQCPAILLFCAGDYPDRYGTLSCNRPFLFDAFLVGDAEWGLMELADKLRDRKRWCIAPNLIFADGKHLRRNSRTQVMDLDAGPAPCYDPGIYPANRPGEKFLVFTVEQSRGRAHTAHSEKALSLREHVVRTKSPQHLLREIMAVTETTGSRALHLGGAHTPPGALEAFAEACLGWPPRLVWSRDAAVSATDSRIAMVLAEAGCIAAGFQVDAGSQRMLEDFHGRDFGVTAIENALQACRSAGIFVSARFTWPCPPDDYHTRAELARILQRCRPDAVILAPPELVPGSLWWQRAADFGFRTERCPCPPMPSRGWFETPAPLEEPAHGAARMRGWSRKKVVMERRHVLENIEDLGLKHGITPLLALLARLSGYEGLEETWGHLARHALTLGDIAGIEELMCDFNGAVLAPANSIAFRPFEPVLRAVAN